MVKKITDPANNPYDFGQDFNYAVWTAGTKVTLTNVPWNNDYRDIVSFPLDDDTTLDDWINEREAANIAISNVSYLKFNIPVTLNIPFNKAFKYNYLRVQNPAQPLIGGDTLKSYYYFILDVKYLAPNATQLTIQLDIFQSFASDFSFGNCFIERGHIGIANENAFSNNGRDYLTLPEGIDYGGEYRVIDRKWDVLMGKANFGNSQVLICSTVDLTADAGSVSNPKLVTAPGSNFEGLPSGASYYIFNDIEDFTSYISSIADTPWVSQGIISITLVPYFEIFMPSFVPDYNDHGPQEISGYNDPGARVFKSSVNWRNSETIVNSIPERYRMLKKFFTSPYMVIEMTTWNGKALILKPESWADPDGTIVETATFTPPNQRVVYRPQRYNANPDSEIENQGHLPDSYFPADPSFNSTGSGRPNNQYQVGDDGGDYLDMITMIDNFPTMAIVNNGALNYLASNFASIPYQKQSAAWTQQRALAGNQTSYDQNAKGIQASKNINALQNAGVQSQAASTNLGLQNSASANALAGLVNGGVQLGLGAANGGIGLGGAANAITGVVMQGVNANIQSDNNNRAANIQNTVSKGSNTAQNNQAAYVNDTNKSLADWSARGDYQNAIAGVNAQINDASMIQPTTSGQAGGNAYNLVNSSVELSLRWKLIDNASIRRVGEYWLRYGYSVLEFSKMPASLKVMTKFTYWKLLETYIVSATMPEGFKQIIRGIFEKGVTVWSDPDDIGNIDLADNVPLEGIVI